MKIELRGVSLPPRLGARAEKRLARRALVIAHPRWYPRIPERVRIALLRFAASMRDAEPVDPGAVERRSEGCAVDAPVGAFSV